MSSGKLKDLIDYLSYICTRPKRHRIIVDYGPNDLRWCEERGELNDCPTVRDVQAVKEARRKG